MDFMHGVLADGRRFRTLNVLDLATRECLAIEVDTSLPGQRMVRLLEQLVQWHGSPKHITLDNGSEFIGQALDNWAYQQQVRLDFIEPGKPTQNGYLESFNGKFRDECFNIHWFRSLADARRLIADWRLRYNTERPHSALCGRPLPSRRYTTNKRKVSRNPWAPFGSQVNSATAQRDTLGTRCVRLLSVLCGDSSALLHPIS